MFQVILIFSDYILIKRIIVSFTLFVLEKTDFQKILPRVLIGELGLEQISKDEIWKDVSLRLILEDKDNDGYQFLCTLCIETSR